MKKRKTHDADLIEQYMRGEESEFEALLKKHEHNLYGFIFSKLGDCNLTEDILQETLVKVIQSLRPGRYNETGNIPALGNANRL